MADTLFTLDPSNYRDCQLLFRGGRAEEFYCGDYWVEDGDAIAVQAKRRSAGPHSIIRISATARQFFRRTRQHIREDSTDLSVLWFVRRGRLTFSNQFGDRTVGPGSFLLTRSMSPFLIECDLDADGGYDALNVTVPTHLLRSHIGRDVATSLYLDGSRELAIAERVLMEVFDDDLVLEESLARTLAEAALSAVGQAVRHGGTVAPARQTMTERRLDDVRRFIEVHLSDPSMSTRMVSRGCTISPRYLSFLLRSSGTSFSELLWRQRLERAREWLGHGAGDEVSISEISYGVGFKSPAHFSRMFKRVYGVNPREFRLHEKNPGPIADGRETLQ